VSEARSEARSGREREGFGGSSVVAVVREREGFGGSSVVAVVREREGFGIKLVLGLWTNVDNSSKII
jgi:hypothetical protein